MSFPRRRESRRVVEPSMLTGNYYVYIMASGKNGTLYIGVTNDLIRRVYQHKMGLADGFTKKHKVHILFHYEHTEDINAAIQREKQLEK